MGQFDKFREIFEKSPIGIIFFDKEGNLTDANPSALEIGGVPSLNDVIGINIFNKINMGPKKDELLQKGLVKFQYQANFDNIKKLGIYNPQHSGTAFIDLTIFIIDSGFLVQIQDINEIKQTEESLKASEEKFRLIANESPMSITVYMDNRHLYVNPAAEALLGYTKEELFNMDYKEFIHPDYQNMIEELAKARMKGETRKKQYEVKIITKNGQEKWTETSSNLIKYEGSPAIIITSIDITERKKIETALKKSKEIYREFFDNPLNGFALCEVITDNSGKPIDFVYKEVNKAFENFTGLKREKVLNRKVTEVLNPEEVAEITQIYGKVALTGNPDEFQYFIPSLGKWFDVAAFSPRKKQFIAFFTDITDRKKIEEDLKEARDNLE